jgi:type IV pilus assembly protein PilC
MYYKYIAYTGEKTVASGVQDAASAEMALKILTGQGYKVLTLKPVTAFLSGREQISVLFNKVPPEAIITFSRQLALLHESGLDIVSALELLAAHTHQRLLKKALLNMVSDLNQGIRLSEAMSKHPGIFSKVYVQSVRIGEQTGNLESSLKHMADYLDREAKSSKSIRNALRYPAIVAVVAVIVIIVLATFVLPSFFNLYRSLNVELPAATQLLLSLMDWFGSYGTYALVAVLFGIVLFYFWTRTAEGKLQWAGITLKIPVLGYINHLNELIRLCRSMAVLYKAGLPVPDILLMVTEGSSNLLVRRSLVKVQQSVLKGEGLARPMGEDPIFLNMLVTMVGVGEATGSLDKTLMAAADTYENEAEDRMRAFVGLIQPAVIIIMGAVVAFIAFSLVSAMYSMYGQIG